ncbi:MAG TPA: sigma-70 family RNA polymerase sigma factor [Puia sp.]|jgi:RNA polymerase sigma-70 factor (ECF subfamily)
MLYPDPDSIRGNDWNEESFQRFVAGDPGMMKSVFERHYRPMCLLAEQILQQNALAEDVVSIVFNKTWENRAKIKNSFHLENYLRFLTRNECISQLRKEGTRKRTDTEWVRREDEPSESPVRFDPWKIRMQVIEDLHHYLETLPPDNVLRLAYLDGKNAKEIAVLLKISVSGVYIEKSRCIKKLRELLPPDLYLLFLFYFAGDLLCIH